MEDSANFIPLGLPKGKLPFDKLRKSKAAASNPDEDRTITMNAHKAAKKEKKQLKADAKRQRKLNGIMNRRMTKNTEKYSKNKDRNNTRAVDAERTRIRVEAVRQAERLAAKHDPSGKIFNVGEVVVLKDGSVRNKEAHAIANQRRSEEKAAKEGKQTFDASQIEPKNTNTSNSQKQRQETRQSHPPPPRPIIPEGISLPEGEESFIALWDITDEQIRERIGQEKVQKSLARKNLRRKQMEEKKMNTALKLLKKQTENRGQKWDPEKGAETVLKQQKGEDVQEESQELSEDENSEGESQDVEELEEVVQLVKPATAEKNSKKKKKKEEERNSRKASSGSAVIEPPAPSPVPEPKQLKKSKQAAEISPVEESKAKKKISKKNKVDKGSSVDIVASSQKEVNDEQSLEEETFALKEDKRAKKEKKHRKRLEKAGNVNGSGETVSRKRKHDSDGVDTQVEKRSHKKKNIDPHGLPPSLDKHDKYYTAVARANDEPAKASGVAAQWNPDALTGEAARKEKFLRLLGAGKANTTTAHGSTHVPSAKATDIWKVQSELERQYEAGMKMKHDGGGKRRGLGA